MFELMLAGHKPISNESDLANEAENELHRDIRPLIRVNILGTAYLAILDTGATFTVGNKNLKDLFEKFHYKSQPDKRKFSTAGGLVPNSGLFKVPIRLKGMSAAQSAQFYIIDDCPILLLGRDFIRKFGVVFSLADKKPYWTHHQTKEQIKFESPFAPVAFTEAHFVKMEDNHKTKEWIKSLDLTNVGSLKEQTALRKLLNKNKAVFSDKPGVSNVFEFEIKLKPDGKLTKANSYPANPQKRAVIDRLLDEQIANDWVEPSNSPMCVPTLCVPKPGLNNFRMCQAYQKLNDITETDTYPLPRPKDLFDAIGQAKYFTVFDMTKGFYQIKVKKDDRWKTAFVNHRGLFQYKVMPFGLKNAPAAFQRLMDKVLGVHRWDFCVCYIDDLIVYSNDFESHLKHIQMVFDALMKAGLTLNPSKSQVCLKEVKYLGHYIRFGKIKPDPDKIKAIIEFPRPLTCLQMGRFIGMVGYYRQFIKGITELIHMLNKMYKRDKPKEVLEWSKQAIANFEEIKRLLADDCELFLPDMTKHFTIRTDASDVGIGAVLLQHDDATQAMRPVWYASRQLNKAERNYSTTHRECLGVIYGVRQFKQYIEFTQFTIETDHQALKWLMALKDPSGRLARWSLELQELDFKIEHIPGTHNVIADALSRDPVDPPAEIEEKISFSAKHMKNTIAFTTTDSSNALGPYPDMNLDSIVLMQRQDEDLKLVIEFLELKVLPSDSNKKAFIRTLAEDCMIFDNDLLVKYVRSSEIDDNFDESFKIVVPKALKHIIFRLHHDHPISGHRGVQLTTLNISRKYVWYKMQKEIRQYVKSCDICQKVNPSNQKPGGTLSPNRSQFPWEIIAIDIVGPLPPSGPPPVKPVKKQKGNRKLGRPVKLRDPDKFHYIFVIIDTLSKWVELFPLKTITAQVIVEKFYETICRFGFPRQVISDNGTQFTSEAFIDICRAFNIDIKFCPTYHAQANPTERINRNIKQYLRKYCIDHSDWYENIPAMGFSLKTNVIGTTKFTPSEVFLGRNLNNPFEVPLQKTRLASAQDVRNYSNNLKNRLKTIFSQARENLQVSRYSYRKNYDHYRRDIVFKVGDLVLYRVHPLSMAKRGVAASLMQLREGPYKVTEVLSRNVYRIGLLSNGAPYARAHTSQLSTYLPRVGEIPDPLPVNRANLVRPRKQVAPKKDRKT